MRPVMVCHLSFSTILFGLALLLVPGDSSARSDLFRIWPNHPAAPVKPGSDGSAIRREWDVEVNMRGIVANSAATQTIVVRMPEGNDLHFRNRQFSDISGFILDGELDFQIDPDAEDSDISYSWYGTSDSAQMTIAVWRGVMSATITGIASPLNVLQSRSGTRLRELDVTLVPPDLDEGPRDKNGFGVTYASPAAKRAGTKAVVAHVNALVVHTPAALAAFGGDRSALNAQIAEAFVQSDSAMGSSGMESTRLLNILAGQADLSVEVPYNEVPGNTCVGTNTTFCRWVGHRIWLRTDSTVAALRNSYSADLVVMIVGDQQGLAGIAYTQRPDCGAFEGYESAPGCTVGVGYEPFAFSVVSHAFMNSFQVFVHETGHQFGMEHQAGGTPSYTWSFARTRSDNQLQTVMGSQGLSRSLQYSNPNVPFIGSAEASGETLRFNARTGQCLAPVMSGFRTPSQPAFVFWDDFETRLIPITGC